MLKSRDAAKLMNAISVAFDKVGAVNGTAMPKSGNNLDPIAYELYVAQTLKRLCDARLESAKDRSIAAGVMFDTNVTRLPAGTVRTVYAGDIVQVGVTTKKPSTTFDRKRAETILCALFPKNADKVKEVFEECSKETAVPHTFSASLITESEG